MAQRVEAYLNIPHHHAIKKARLEDFLFYRDLSLQHKEAVNLSHTYID